MLKLFFVCFCWQRGRKVSWNVSLQLSAQSAHCKSSLDDYRTSVTGGWQQGGYQKWHSWWWLLRNPNLTFYAPPRSMPPPICGGRTHTDARVAKQFTSVSMSTGLMPKKGLMAMPGTISASGSDGFGAMQMPPVSEVKTEQRAESEFSS